MDYDVVVIGGGPVGCAVARDVAAAGFTVLVVEEHRRVGEPLQCAGLISPRTLELSRVSPQVILHKLTGARVHAPGGRVLQLAGKRPYALAIDRIAFDRDLAAQALSAGAEIWFCARATGLRYITGGVEVELHLRQAAAQEGGAHGLPAILSGAAGRGPVISDGVSGRETYRRYVTCRLVVGADGHNSLVARWLDLPPPPEKVSMYAAEVELPGSSGQLIDIFLGRRVAPGWFAWVIPTGAGRARVGVGSARPRCGLSFPRGYLSGKPEDRVRFESEKDVLEGLSGEPPRLLWEKLAGLHPDIFRGMRIVRGTGGLVPVGFMPRTYGSHALVVGDAACHVKPISGGGLYLGLEAARLCAHTVVTALKAGNYSEDFLARYQRAWEKAIGLEIRCGIRHREVFLSLSDREMDMLIAFFDKPYWRKLILKYGDLDYHSRLAARLALAPPWAQRFMVNGLKALLGYCSLEENAYS